MPHLKIDLLGVPLIWLNSQPLPGSSRLATALLAYLAVSGQPHSRDALAAVFWPDQDQSSARAYLRNTLWTLNRAGLQPWLSAQKDRVSLDGEYELDVKQLVDAVESAQPYRHASEMNCLDCAERLARAAGLYRGDFMAGFSLHDNPEFDKWQTLQTEHLRLVFAAALELLAGYLDSSGDSENAIEAARKRANLDLLDEPSQRDLMRLQARYGQRSQALKQYETLARTLEEELGIQPEEESQKLYQDILHNRFPERVPQPAFAAQSEKPRGPRLRLPAQLTSFIGRKHDLNEVQSLLAGGTKGAQAVRLLTLTGPGGSGKTRLALQVASGLVDRFREGVYFVDLAPVNQSEHVPAAIARALEIHEVPGRAVVDTLKETLGERRILLVLDNFEHLVSSSPVVSELLASAPDLSILVTSREVLHLYGEQVYEVPPLELPLHNPPQALSDLIQNESVQLFLQRARSVQPAFEITAQNAAQVAEICIRLDGLPLAIELAAARTSLLSLEQLLTQLSDRFKILRGGPRDTHVRQQTLRGTIDWSYNLLPREEQRLLARMSVFQSKNQLKAVESVCGVDLQLDVGEGIESLLGKSLLRREIDSTGDPRFTMLETIREYAREKMEQLGEAELLRQRHAHYYVELAELVEPDTRAGPRQIEWLHQLEAEHSDLLNALSWSLDGGDIELGLRLTGALIWFWNRQHHFAEWGLWIQRALQQSEGLSTGVRATVLLGAGQRAYFLQEPQAGVAYLREAADMFRALNDRSHLAWSLMILGMNLAFSSPESYDEAVLVGEEGLAICRELNDRAGIAQALNALGELVRNHGDYERAAVLYEESLALAREIGDRLREQMMSMNLGYVAYHHGNYQLAETLFTEGIGLAVELDLKPDLVKNFGFLAGAIGQQGQVERAARLMAICEKLTADIGIVHQPADQLEYDHYKASIREKMGDAAFRKAWDEGLALSEKGLDWVTTYALKGEYQDV